MSKNQNYVTIIPANGKVQINWNCDTFYKPMGESTRGIACYIPAFDVHFQVKEIKEISKKSNIITKMFFDHYITHQGKGKLKGLVLTLHKMGFKAPNDLVVLKQFMHDETVKARFVTNKSLPAEFLNAQVEKGEEMAMSV